MKKKISFIKIVFAIFTTIIIVSSIFSFYILHHQEEARVYNDINKGLNEDSKNIKTYLNILYKTIKLSINNVDNKLNYSDINYENYEKILEHSLKTNKVFNSDGILIKDLDNNKIFYIKGNKKELFSIPISNNIQTIKINDTEYVVKHFLYKNEIFDLDIILYSNVSKVHYMVWNKIKKNFLLIIIFIVIILFILNIVYNNLMIRPTNKLINSMEHIIEKKEFSKIANEFLIKEIENIKNIFNETIKNIKSNQVEIENLLKKSEYDKNFYLDILDSLDTIIIVNDRKTLKIVNKPFFEFFDGFKSLEEFKKIHSCVCDYFIKEEGFIYPFENQNWIEYLIEHPNILHKVKIKKNNEIYIFKISAEKLKRSENIVITMADITQLEKDKEEIERLNNYLNQYIDFINKSSIVSKTDIKGIIIYANEEFCKISGYSKEELIGKPHNIVRHPDTPKEVFKDLWKTILSGKIWKGELKNRHKNGSDYYVKSIIAPIMDNNGNIQEFIAIRQDITDIVRAMQKAKEAEQAKMLFLSNMSHEIRTPLNGILGFTELLLKSGNISGKEKKYLEIIDASGKGLLNIINDILDIAKIESGNITLEEKEFNPAIAFKQIAELFKAKALEKNIDYEVNIDINHSVNVIGDEYKIKQVISNLVNNAIKFTPENGKVELKIKKEKETKEYLTLCFYVKDTGIGIPKDKQDKIFEAFSQADNSITRKFGGTGLGLNISSKIVEKMGSKLKVESEEGKGSTFYFCIDLKKSNKKDDLMLALESIVVKIINCDRYDEIKNYVKDMVKDVLIIEKLDKIDKNDLIFTKDERLVEKFSDYKNHFIIVGKNISKDFNQSELLDTIVDFLENNNNLNLTEKENKNNIIKNIIKAKVLIAEDNLVNQQLLGALLDNQGIKYEIANDGIEAIEKFKNDKFDLIFMDMNMPNIDGITAIKKIKEYEKENGLKHTPIIMLTANAMRGDKERFLEYADGYLAKPIDSKELFNILSKFIYNKTEKKEESKEIDEKSIKKSDLVYNKQEVAKSIGIPEDIFDNILETFFKNIKLDMENLKEAMDSKDFNTISKVAHKIKGSAATIKFDELAEIAKIIEESAREEKEIDYKSNFLQMQKILDEYKKAVQ